MNNGAVLVVDDDPVVRRLVRIVLEADDRVVLEAADGHDALACLQRDRPAVVVLDVMLPGVDGIDLCRAIDTSTTKVVVLTAKTDPETEKACREAGCHAFLTKPFSSIDLLDLVEELER